MCLLSSTPDQQGYLKSRSPDVASTSRGAHTDSNSDQTGMSPILFLRCRPGSLTTKNRWRRPYWPNTLHHHGKLLTSSTPPQHGAMGVSVEEGGVFGSPHFAHLSPFVQSVSRWRVAFIYNIFPPFLSSRFRFFHIFPSFPFLTRAHQSRIPERDTEDAMQTRWAAFSFCEENANHFACTFHVLSAHEGRFWLDRIFMAAFPDWWLN